MPCYHCQSPEAQHTFSFQAGKTKENHHIVVKKKILNLSLCNKCLKMQKKINNGRILKRIGISLIGITFLSIIIYITRIDRLIGIYPFMALVSFLGLLDLLAKDPMVLADKIVNTKAYSPEFPILYSPEKLKRLSAAHFMATDIEYLDEP